MAARSLNRVQLIGNLTRDPELRYTPNQKAVATFTVATTRRWVTNGVRKEETEFHRIVAWDKLAEICAQILTKGSKVYVEGRMHYRSWTTAENVRRDVAEVIITDLILLSGGKQASSGPRSSTAGAGVAPTGVVDDQLVSGVPSDVSPADMSLSDEELDVIELPDDDLPFETEEEKTQQEEVKTEAQVQPESGNETEKVMDKVKDGEEKETEMEEKKGNEGQKVKEE